MELHQPTKQHKVETIPPNTEDQLMEACGSMGNTKAPSLNEIPNITLKAAFKVVSVLFLEVYNVWIRRVSSLEVEVAQTSSSS